MDKKIKELAGVPRHVLIAEREEHPDDWIQEENMYLKFKQFIYKNPGMTRFELARWSPIDEDYDFRKAVSHLKHTGEIREDEEGFFYVKTSEVLVID